MNEQPLFNFDGETYDQPRDQVRLSGQALRVWRVLEDGNWHTLAGIKLKTGDPEASISARIRDFRKVRWGRNVVQAEHVKGGLWRYRLTEEFFG
jgi:uncharacterized protein (DUF2132 family)